MKIFYIDTSSSYLYTGIVADNKLLGCVKKELGKDLSRYTLVEVEKLFKNLNLKPNDIDKIIVVSGPGSFTGIRIGMTMAKIYAWSLKKEITTITSLDAMAASVDVDCLKVPLIDARRGFVYAGIYQDNEIILENQYLKLEELEKHLDSLDKEFIYITNQSNFKFSNIKEYDPNILEIVNHYKDKPSINPHLVEPTYLKLTEAEENLGNRA